MILERRDGTGKAVLVLPVCEAVPEWLDSALDAAVLRVGPRRWIVLSDDRNGAALIAAWQQRLVGVTHLFEDASDRFVMLRVAGAEAIRRVSEQLVQPLDMLIDGSVVRTLLGDVPVICRRYDSGVDLLVDRSHAHYAQAWIERTPDAP